MRGRTVVLAVACVISGPLQSLAADVEHQAALDGTQYAVIAPTYTDPSGTQSYFRLFNGGSSSAVVNMSVVGSPSGQLYGTKAIVIPAYASPQFSMATILSLAGAGALTGSDTSYALYLQSTEPAAGYQHVTFNAVTSLFSNSSTCGALLNDAILAASKNRVLNNVHTSRLASFPSTIYVHNYRNVQTTYRLTVVDAGSADATTGAIRSGSGAVIGTTNVTVAANETYTTTAAALETALGWSPTSSQVNTNIIVSDTSGAATSAVVSQAIINPTLVGPINMATACAINNPNTATATATTTYAGTIAGANGQTGTMSVTVQASIASAFAASLDRSEKAQATAQVSGTLVTGGSSIGLTGSYDSANSSVTLTGGNFTFTGTVASGVLSGSYTGANNSGGAFSTVNATHTPVTRYCGTWNDGTGSGTFNIQVSASGTLTGVTYGGQGVTLTGQQAGSAISGSSSQGVSFSGTSGNGSMSGTFVPLGGGSGSFSGSTCS